MADQEINLRQQCFRIDRAITRTSLAEAGDLIPGRIQCRHEHVTSAVASIAVGGLPGKLPRV